MKGARTPVVSGVQMRMHCGVGSGKSAASGRFNVIGRSVGWRFTLRRLKLWCGRDPLPFEK